VAVLVTPALFQDSTAESHYSPFELLSVLVELLSVFSLLSDVSFDSPLGTVVDDLALRLSVT
jgi:hypothetical protein